MTTKPLLLAVMLALPITANAEYTYNYVNTPAQVSNNGTVTETNVNGPYQTITPGEHDDEHIASTKYVIGAYNDVIAAVNRLYEDSRWKQDLLYTETHDKEFRISEEVLDSLDDASHASLASSLAVKNAIEAQRVEVYTNWDDDTDKTEVAFVTASAQE